MGIYGRNRDSDGICWVLWFADLGGVLMGTLKVSSMFLTVFFGDSDRVLMGFQWNVLRTLPLASSCFDS
jgi:hypothetical protein